MNKLKVISVVWGIVVFIIFAGLTTLGFMYKSKTQKYKSLENKMVEMTKKYTANDFKYPMGDEVIVIKFQELKDNGYMDKLEIDKKTCDGYVELTFDGVTKYKAFIKCDKYTTHGYKKM